MTRAVAEERNENALVRYFRETRAELGKVSWPTREEGIRLTTIVLVTTLFAGLAIFLIDTLFSALIGLLIRLTS